MTTFATNPVLRHYWYPVALADSVGGTGAPGPVAVELLGTRVALWRSFGQVRAFVDRCPHREAPLSMGTVVDGCLVCPYHGWTYAANGSCVAIPSQPANLPFPRSAVATTIDCVERYGMVWVCLEEPAAGIVDVAEDGDQRYRRINCSFEVWNASATRLMDNFADYSHFPFTHHGSFGAVMDARVPTIAIETDGDMRSFSFTFEAANPALAHQTTQTGTLTVTRSMTHGWGLPFTVRNVIGYETGLRHVVLIVLTPIDDDRTIFTMTIFRNDDHAVPVDSVVELDRRVVAEDRRMVEAIPGPLPLDLRRLVHVQADRPSVDWARRFAALLAGGPVAADL